MLNAVSCGILPSANEKETIRETEEYIASLISRVPSIATAASSLEPITYDDESGVCCLPVMDGYRCLESGCSGVFGKSSTLIGHYQRIHKVQKAGVNVTDCKCTVQRKFEAANRYVTINLPAAPAVAPLPAGSSGSDATASTETATLLNDTLALWDTPPQEISTPENFIDKLNRSRFYGISQVSSTLVKLDDTHLIKAAQLVVIPRRNAMSQGDTSLQLACVGFIHRINTAISNSTADLRKIIQCADHTDEMSIEGTTSSTMSALTTSLQQRRRWFFSPVQSVDAYATTLRYVCILYCFFLH